MIYENKILIQYFIEIDKHRGQMFNHIIKNLFKKGHDLRNTFNNFSIDGRIKGKFDRKTSSMRVLKPISRVCSTVKIVVLLMKDYFKMVDVDRS